MKCLIRAWHQHEAALRRWLYAHARNADDAEDLLQDVFEKAMLQGKRFCSIDNARAWLFQVARNALIDRYRMQHEHAELPNELPDKEPEENVIGELSGCLPRVLSELSAEDREVITQCDLNGMPQQHYADTQGISLSAAKSRIQRARRRLRQTLEKNCQVRRDSAGNVCCFVSRTPR
ncbi:MAG: RNA polymerase sigma factor SigZ [Gammaproteobacteria bacterium]|nr:MAG: RNA polymerase sigma factor SigZ [Gammaproteobacteria bacterium]